MLTPAMAQEVWKSPERPSIEKRPGRCANTVSIPGLTTKQDCWPASKLGGHTRKEPGQGVPGGHTTRPFPSPAAHNDLRRPTKSLMR